MSQWTSILAATVALSVSCAQHAAVIDGESDEFGGDYSGKGDEARAVYPVAPSVHVSNDAILPTNPGDVEAELPNAVAYARYALRLVQPWPLSVDVNTAWAVAQGWADAANMGSVPPRDGRYYATLTATYDQQQSFAHALYSDDHDPAVEPSLTKVQQRLVDIQAGFGSCVSDGFSSQDCCISLGYFAALSRTSDLTSLNVEQLDGDFYSTWATARAAKEEEAVALGDKVMAQPFVHLGIKAWLSQCAPVLQHTAASVAQAKLQYGDWESGMGWIVELHPVSTAKLAGRRIFRRTLADGTQVSVADSLGADCRIRETEIIVAPVNGPLEFLSYDHKGDSSPRGFFPTASGKELLKLTPDSCMGCHYTFDQRRFSVVAPSFEALSLKLPVRDGVPQWRDDIGCAQETDQIIRHAAPMRNY